MADYRLRQTGPLVQEAIDRALSGEPGPGPGPYPPSDYFTKEEIYELLSDYYTKEEIDAMFNFATREDILALFGIGGGNYIENGIIYLADANYIENGIIYFNDATTIENETINLY